MGLGPEWTCLFANDFDDKKGAVYRKNWRDDVLKTGDIRNIKASALPGRADLAWGSFPCQDLSLAGGGAGLKGERSAAFWPFWDIMVGLQIDGRAPKLIVLENVCGALTSHGGSDFRAICSVLSDAGYRVGAVVVDAALFVPQSRPRLFIIAVQNEMTLPIDMCGFGPSDNWHTPSLRRAYEAFSDNEKRNWIWWRISEPPLRNTKFADLIESQPKSVRWHTPEETRRLVSMMDGVNKKKVVAAMEMGELTVGAIYKRTRRDENGNKVQRAEVRFDDIAGCLRTPAGGSSRQLIIVVNGQSVKSRLISGRETARLMGLPEEYQLPENYNEVYHLTGDGVVVSVVRHLAANIFEPILRDGNRGSQEAA